MKSKNALIYSLPVISDFGVVRQNIFHPTLDLFGVVRHTLCMAYEKTEVPVIKSQDGIRKLIMSHKGFGVAFISELDPTGQLPAQEGFHAKVMIKEKPYTVRITAHLKVLNGYASENQKAAFVQQEERRVWRVLFHHMKSVFEAADTGVMEFRELMMPYIVMPNGNTIAEQILPMLDAKLAGRPDRLLAEGAE